MTPAEHTSQHGSFADALGIRMIDVAGGTFAMGDDSSAANWDEQPIRSVTLSPFAISETAVTIEQFRKFKPDVLLNERYAPFAAGVSWHDAEAFCRWLGEQTGQFCRLPTEAEWEFAARAGALPFDEVRNWCLDWYGDYGFDAEVNPIGPDIGLARIVRGGVLDEESKHCPREKYARPTNRAGMAPAFAPVRNDLPVGRHCIGFRVVMSKAPLAPPTPALLPYARQGVKQTTAARPPAPSPGTPGEGWGEGDFKCRATSDKQNHLHPNALPTYRAGGPELLRKRRVLPMPPDDDVSRTEQIRRCGLHPSFRNHNHSPAMEVLANGDLLALYYSSFHEYDPEVGLIATRLRFGADEWDMPSMMFDMPGANDHAPLLWNDDGTIWLFWGNPQIDGRFPFQFTISTDNGATWSEVVFPHLPGPIGEWEKPQPINIAFRSGGTIFLATDARGATSMLWASDDNGRTWRDTGGRTFGRHTTFVPLRDGRILGMGGKGTEIGGFLPRSISTDNGRSYQVSRTPFAALTSGQRPCIVRLASGRLFFAGDFQNKQARQPAGVNESGCYVALSDDDGQSWHIKKLAGTQNGGRLNDTLGYCVARQAGDGNIHLITSVTHPALHFEMNEAWILSDQTNVTDAGNAVGNINEVRQHRESFADGTARVLWHAGFDSNRRYLLHGHETWYHANGRPQRQAQYDRGRKTGIETLYASDGSKIWQWEHAGGTAVWTTYWPNDRVRSISKWKDRILVAGSDQFFD